MARSFFTRVRLSDSEPCPCGGAAQKFLASSAAPQSDAPQPVAPQPDASQPAAPSYGHCCGPLHQGERLAANALELMASRYSAYVAHEAEYVWQTWHPRSRPEVIQLDDAVAWQGLEILAFEETEREAVVEFRAHFIDESGAGSMHERSIFHLRAKRWMYVDGDVSYDGA